MFRRNNSAGCIRDGQADVAPGGVCGSITIHAVINLNITICARKLDEEVYPMMVRGYEIKLEERRGEERRGEERR